MSDRKLSRVMVAGAAVLGLALAGCGTTSGTAQKESDTTSSEATSASSSTSAAPSPTATAGANQTVDEYLKANGIERTIVKRGDPGTPTLNLPIPAGWRDLGADAPETAWGAIVLDDPALGNNAPAIIATMAKLTGGSPDPAKLLELAPNAVRNLPQFNGPETGQPGQLGGLEATTIGGTFVKDGTTMLVARKTVVITGKDGLYLLALDAQGPEDQAQALMSATAAIDAETTIEP